MRRSWFFGLLSVLIAAVAVAKAPTTKLAISGPGLVQPVEFTQGAAVAANVWFGTFMSKEAAEVAEPSTGLPRYTVKFYVGQQPRLAYVVYYVWDSRHVRGLVQIPAHEDEWYRLNLGSIGRCCEGHWFEANETWAAAINAVLPRKI